MGRLGRGQGRKAPTAGGTPTHPEPLPPPMGTMLSSMVYAELGWAALERGEPATAIEHFTTGLSGSSAAKHLVTPAMLLGLARARMLTGDPVEAETLVAQASELVETKGMAHLRPQVAAGRWALALAEGEVEQAATVFADGAGLAAAMGADDVQWRLHAAHAGALRMRGDDAAAEAAAGSAEAVVTAMAGRFADPVMRDGFVAAARARIAALVAGGVTPPTGRA